MSAISFMTLSCVITPSAGTRPIVTGGPQEHILGKEDPEAIWSMSSTCGVIFNGDHKLSEMGVVAVTVYSSIRILRVWRL
jgi:hypothetical protein